MNKKRPERIIAVLLALIMMLSTGIIVLAEDYGMQGSKRKLQMTEPDNVVVNSSSETDYNNTISNPVALTDGTASFQFKMDAFGGQTTGADDPVAFLQGKVDSDVTFTDVAGNTVAGSKVLVTSVDKSSFIFNLGISGLSFDTSYVLTFKSSFTTGGSNWAIGVNIKFTFTTVSDPEAPHIYPVPAAGITCNPNYGYGTVNRPWEQGEIGMQFRIDPMNSLADQYAEENYKQFSLTSYYGDEIPITVGPGQKTPVFTFYKVGMTLAEQGWYCLTVGKDFKNDAGKTIGDYTGGQDQIYWILKPTSKTTNGNTTVYYGVDLTTNLQKITYEDTSADNAHRDEGKVAMDYLDTTCPDYLVKLTAADGYLLPAEVSITINGKELTAEKDYTYTPETLQIDQDKDGGEHEYNLKVDRHAINGPVVITAAAVKPVTGVTLDKTELNLDEGDSATLAATVSPEDASNKNVTWTSSDEKVATVDATGKVTAVKAGTATITVTTEDGEKTATCAVTVKHKHVEEVVPGKAATCTDKGLTDGKKCSVCGEVLEAQKDIPALGHKEEVVKGKAATCTEKGLTDGKKCSVCGEVLEAQKDIPALGHDFKDGKCTRCDVADPDFKPTPVEPDTKFTGLANEADKDGNWWYYTDGKIDKTHTGVDQNKYGWWRVENGKVNFKAQGIYQNKYGWWKTTDGEVTFKENSIYQNEYGWWKCKDSKVDFNAQSIYSNKYG